MVHLPFEIQSYKDKVNFEITHLEHFDFVIWKQWHAMKKPVIDFSSHIIQSEHGERHLMIRGEQDTLALPLFACYENVED